MTLFRYKKNKKLYLLFENYGHYHGRITAEAYNHFDQLKNKLNIKDFQKVAII